MGAVGETGAASTLVQPLARTATPVRKPRQRRAAPDRPHAEDVDALAGDGPRARRRRRRWPWLVGLLVIIVAGIGVAAWTWAADQWYVGIDTGNVAVYTGVDVSLGPIRVPSSPERTTIEAPRCPSTRGRRSRAASPPPAGRAPRPSWPGSRRQPPPASPPRDGGLPVSAPTSEVVPPTVAAAPRRAPYRLTELLLPSPPWRWAHWPTPRSTSPAAVASPRGTGAGAPSGVRGRGSARQCPAPRAVVRPGPAACGAAQRARPRADPPPRPRRVLDAAGDRPDPEGAAAVDRWCGPRSASGCSCRARRRARPPHGCSASPTPRCSPARAARAPAGPGPRREHQRRAHLDPPRRAVLPARRVRQDRA